MTGDSGWIRCSFCGDPATLSRLDRFVAETDRQNQFSYGLSWLDELDADYMAESELVSFDTMAATREFLTLLLAQIPDITFEGQLEHCWSVGSAPALQVVFSVRDGQIFWEETPEESPEEFAPAWEDPPEEEWEYPTEP